MAEKDIEKQESEKEENGEQEEENGEENASPETEQEDTENEAELLEEETEDETPEGGEEEIKTPEDESPKKEEQRGGKKKSIADLPKPVKVGDEIEVTIESVGAKGDGIAKKEGFVIFIPGVQKGDTLMIKIVELKTSFAIGEKI